MRVTCRGFLLELGKLILMCIWRSNLAKKATRKKKNNMGGACHETAQLNAKLRMDQHLDVKTREPKTP